MNRGFMALLMAGGLALAGCATGTKKYSHYDMGRHLLSQQKTDEAIEEFKASVAVDPEDPTVWNALGEVYYAKGMRGAAIEAWEKTLATGSTDPAFYQQGGRKRGVEWIGDGTRAFQSAREAILKPYLEQAQEYWDKGMISEAAATWTKVVGLKKDHLDSWKALGKAYKKLKDLPGAMGAYKNAATLSPKEWQLWKEYGYAAFQLSKLNEAEEAFRRWTELDPTNPLGFNNLGAVLAKLERFNESYETYDKALEKQPDMIAALNGKATAYYYQKNYEEARRLWAHVLELSPDDQTAKENIRTLVKMGF